MAYCIAEPLSRANIQVMADRIRLIEGCKGKYFFDIVHFLDVTLPRLDPSFTLSIKTKEEMGECHGLTYPDRNEIQIREDVYERAYNGSGRDRLTLAHELFHLLQHEKENISFARSENIEPFRDPEWQASAFGGELLMPHDMIVGMSVEEVMKKCKVSMSAASYQLKKCKEKMY